MNLMDLLAANQQPGGPAGMVDRGQDPGGIAAFLPQAQSAQPPAHKRGLFGSGISGWGFLGALGDALQGAAGKEGTFGPMVARQRELQMQNQGALSRQIALAQWRHLNPDTPASIAEANAINAMTPEQRAAYGSARDLVNPATTNGPQGTVIIPRGMLSGMGGVQSGGTHGSSVPVGGVYRDPATGASFRRIAPGDSQDSWQPIGGAGPSGPQTFR